MKSKKTKKHPPTRRRMNAIVTPLSSEATMVGYLLEVGWELHVAGDVLTRHKIFKATKIGNTTTVQHVNVSSNAVIELHKSGRLKKKSEFTVNHLKTTVYVSA